MPDDKIEHQAPDVLALVLADTILRDAFGKCYIQGTYNAIFAPQFPLLHSIVVYLAITSGHGKTPLTIRLIDTDEAREPIFEEHTGVDFPDPFVVAEMVFAKAPVIFPEPGEYRLQMYCAGALLRERRIHVGPPPGSEHG
jgi:hypothetical protein